MKLLIAYDASAGALAAIDDLGRAGLGDAIEARVLTVADVLSHLLNEPQGAAGGTDPLARMAANARAEARQAVAQAQKQAEEGAQRVRELFPAWKVEAHGCGDSPHWGIVKEAAGWKADLVLVGAQGRSGIRRLVLGSASQQVIMHAPCSVRVGRARAGRGNGKSDDPVRLVIGVDGSVGAATAIAAVASRKWPAGSEAGVVTAMDLQITMAVPLIFSDRSPAATDPEALMTSALHRVSRELEEAGLRAEPVVRQGNPRRVLLEEAEKRQADCIFVGATGLTRMERLLLGSVSTSVANDAQCSVEIVRA